jgi:hypothetical protein
MSFAFIPTTSLRAARDQIHQSFYRCAERQVEYKRIVGAFISEGADLPKILSAYTSYFNRMDAHPFRAEWRVVAKSDILARFPKHKTEIEKHSEDSAFGLVIYQPLDELELEVEVELPPEEPGK